MLTALLLLSHTLINRIHEQHWVLDLGLNDWPQLLDEETQAATLLLRLVQFLVEEFLTILKQLDQLLVLSFELLHLVQISFFLFDMLIN